MNKKYDAPDEDMQVTITLEDDTEVTCDVITILEVDGKDYIVLLPVEPKELFEEDEAWFYEYRENPDDPNEEPELVYIEDDAVYDKVGEAFDEYLDALEFDDLSDDDE